MLSETCKKCSAENSFYFDADIEGNVGSDSLKCLICSHRVYRSFQLREGHMEKNEPKMINYPSFRMVKLCKQKK